MQEEKKDEEKQQPHPNTSPSWAELLGSDHWTGLLDPLDDSLRSLILRCGDLCQVTYDAFISDPHSKYCGASRYGKPALLSKCLVPFASDYTVSDFLYATASTAPELPLAFLFSLSREAWSKESNWIGYVAVSSDDHARATGRRDVFVAWRGTIRDLEWVDVLHPKLVSIPSLLSLHKNTTTTSTSTSTSTDDDEETEEKVMEGWHTIYTSTDTRSPFNKASARDQLLSVIARLVNLHRGEQLSVICVGHSLGAALAVLSAFDVARSFPALTVCAVIFGSPQVGNEAFNQKLYSLPNVRVLRIKNKIDLIPLYPTGVLGYVNTGTALVVDTRRSPFLKESKNPSDWHNLEGTLHTVAGWNGEKGEFGKGVKMVRSVGLVNKSCEYLKDELLVPGSWWVEKNRGMVLGKDGEWGLAPLDQDDLPLPPISGTWTNRDDKDDDENGKKNQKEEEAKSKSSGFLRCAACFRGA